MPAKDEQTPPQKRIKSRADTIDSGRQDPIPLINPAVEGKSRPLSRQIGNVRFNEGLADTPRTNTSVLRHSPVLPARRVRQPSTTPMSPQRQKTMAQQLQPHPAHKIVQKPQTSKLHQIKHMHWLFFVGLIMMMGLILWITGTAALAWGIQRYNDLRYGIPRTYQVDQVVGQGGDSLAHPSHFIALNENHQAIVIELQAGNPTKSFSYTAPLSNDNGEAPVTLEFRDVTSDGKTDMIVHIHLLTQEQIAVFINNGSQFLRSNGKYHINT